MRHLEHVFVLAAVSVVLPLTLLAPAACSKKKTSAADSASSAAVAPASVTTGDAKGAVAARGAAIPRDVPMPAGPALAVLAGQGLGPIRFGATVKTIERLMETPCEERSASMCRYVTRAVEFHLGEDGALREVRVHRPGRPAGESRTYGMFHGAIPPDIKMLMLPWAVQEVLGKPSRVEKVSDGGAFYTAEHHHYEGMMLEYDRLQNGNLVLGGIVVTKKPGS
jgi:hypothetical protein